MPAVATSVPGVMAVCNLSGPERKFVKAALLGARAAGYETVVEPVCCGTFALLHAAREAGFAGTHLHASDVYLFSALMGYGAGADGATLAQLELELDVPWDRERGELQRLLDAAVAAEDAATVLWLQMYLRACWQYRNVYLREIADDMWRGRAAYIAQIDAQVRRARDVLAGMRYVSEDPRLTVERWADEPRAVIAMNAHCYKGGYERFYDTGGMLRWAQPEYEVFDPAADKAWIVERCRAGRALLLHYEECEPGAQYGEAVMVTPNRRRSPHGGAAIAGYLTSNRASEVMAYAGGHGAVDRKPLPQYEAVPWPTLAQADLDALTRDTPIQVVELSQGQAQRQRALWTHKFVGGQADGNFALLLGGKLAGVFGYTTYFTAVNPAMLDALLLTYGMAPPLRGRRLNRLLTRVGCTREMVARALSPWKAAVVTRMLSTQQTRYPESKEMRGLMRLAERKADDVHGWKLVYERPVIESSLTAQLREWLADEAKYMVAKGKGAHGRDE